ncbi:prolyl oligopeptidase family serine peptidase [Candidatus Bathyarchaeota archaeon]|nr:prolyl oligopeptidase family serine peptidase [Candidatus Bathyarchaeota archaeon]
MESWSEFCMHTSWKKFLSLILLYTGIMLPAIFLSIHGNALVDQYYAGYEIQVHTLRTADGYRFDFMTVIHENQTSAPDESVPGIVACHGLGNSKEKALKKAIHFARNGYFVMIPDFRGMGSHGGFIRLDKEWQDTVRMLDFVQDSENYLEVNMSNIGTWGHSNGAFQSVMAAIHDERIQACVASAGAYNTSELLAHQDSRLYIVGFTWDPDNEEEIRTRSPIELANETNPANLLLFHGTDDTNVPYVHSQQFNQTVNPDGNRTDYEFITRPGENHGIVDPPMLRKSIAWFKYYLEGTTVNESSIKLFSPPAGSSFKEIDDTFETVLFLVTAGFVPLVYILETMVGGTWNAILQQKGVKTTSKLKINTSHVKEITARCREHPRYPLNDLEKSTRWKGALITLSGWMAINLVMGAVLQESMISRVLLSFGIPAVVTLVFTIIADSLLTRGLKTRTPPSIILSGMKAAPHVSGGTIKDFIVAALTVLPAWVLQVTWSNALLTSSTVHVESIGILLEAHPRSPISPGIFLLLGIFVLGTFVTSTCFRGTFTLFTFDTFDNLLERINARRLRRFKRFFAWLGLSMLHAIFAGMLIIAGATLFNLFFPNPFLTGVDIRMRFNLALVLILGLITTMAVFLQQVLEKVLRSQGKSILIIALVMLSIFINVAPRPA